MNDIALLTDVQLSKEVELMNKRIAALDTPKGQAKASERMLEILRMIEAAGYQPKSDVAEMAVAWVMLLREQIEAYGFDVIRDAACQFIRNDIRQYKQFPSVGQIVDACNAIGRNPKAELNRRRQDAMIEKEKADMQAEIDAMPREYVEACVRKCKFLWGGCGD